MKKLMSLTAALLALVMILSGCSMIAVNEERDDAVVVATVNGEPITKGEYKIMYRQYANYMGIDEITAGSSAYADQMKEVRQSLLDQMVEAELTDQMAEQYGFNELSAEQEQKVLDNFYRVIDLATAPYLLDEDGNTIEDPTDEQKEEARAKVLSDSGVNKDEYLDQLRRAETQQLLYDELTDMASVTVDEVKAKYDELLAADQETYQGNEAEYESADAAGTVALYVPSGLRYVKHILIGFDNDARQELSDLRDAETVAEGDEASAETLARREELGQDLLKEAEDVLAKVKGGMKFEDAMTEYSDDTQDPESEGYVMAASGTTFDSEFQDAAFMLKKPGDISDPVLTDFGYHIILYVGDVQPGPKTLEDTVQYGYDDDMNKKTMTVYEYVETQLLDEQKEQLFAAAVQVAKNNAKIKTYVDRVKDVK